MVESNKAVDAKANEVSNIAVESTAEAAEVNQNVA